ncbi:hypothetical protein Goshw_027168 [Gossypium schwendimanii]|uniref:Uncharacterized protein n=1 Tax=Gossypium schwendimanii TaxID=34291 RepID=A0A7J9KUY3_GOSSC|nr:hypothetical protein [Gossypium schwendimanii]
MVKLASIANSCGGRASLKKRRFRLWKEVSELTNLRRIKVDFIIYRNCIICWRCAHHTQWCNNYSNTCVTP